MADTKMLDVLAEYAAQQLTGTVMAVFADNSIGRFYVVGGIPTTARYRNRQGGDALDLAQQNEVSKVTFHQEADLVRSSELMADVTLPAGQPAAVAAPKPAAPPAETIPAGQELTGRMRNALEDLLAEYIGPVAPLIVSDLPSRIAIDVAIDRLASEITEPGQASRFVRAARTNLG